MAPGVISVKPLVSLQPLNVSDRVDCGQNLGGKYWKMLNPLHSVQVVTVNELWELRFQELLLKK